MQRFDAIFSFIEQKYSLKDGFFDLSVMADTLALAKEGKIIQKEPKIDEKICRKIVNYLLPISKASALDTIEIEETLEGSILMEDTYLVRNFDKLAQQETFLT